MSTERKPLQWEDLKFFALGLAATGSDINNVVSGDKPDLAQLAQKLKRLKILVTLTDIEIKQLRKLK